MELTLTTEAGETFDAYLLGSNKAKRGILIIHDWWGLQDYNKACANYFHELGCQALAIDLYEGHHPENTKEAGEYMRSINQEAANRKLRTALQSLHKKGRKLAVLGWSFGGVQAQYAAVENPDLVQALVLYYCRIVLDKQNVQALQAPMLAIFAETERTWPDKQMALENLMLEFDKTLECHSYDADHGFANPESLHYDPEVTEEARQVTLEFLNKYL